MNARQRRERDREADFIAAHYNKGETGVASSRDNEVPSCGGGDVPPEPSPHTPLNPNGDTPMPEVATDTTALAAIDPGVLTSDLDALRHKPLTRMVVEEAKEWDDRAKVYLDSAEKSEVRKKINELFGQHKFWLGKYRLAVDPIIAGRQFVSRLFAQWETARKAEADRQRREREEEARKEQERQRIEEAAHLESLGHKEEAEAHLAAPLPPVALPDEKEPAGKVAGVSVIETYKLDRIIDPKMLAGYFVEHPEDLIALMEPKANEWKRRATSSKGQWVVPGVTFIKQIETRNRS